MGAHFYELFPFRLTSSAWLHSAHVVYGQEERMDGLQIGDLAFNEATNKKKKSNFFCPGKHMCTLGWPSMLFPSHQNLLPASDVRNSVSYYPVCELLCSFMSYGCFSYDLVFVFICEIPIVPEILKETPYIRKDWGWKGFFPELQTWLTRWKSTPMLKFWLCDSNFNCSLRGIWVHP